MIAAIEHNLDAIDALCREYGVSRLEVFGSAATDEFDPTRSDIDFLVDYAPGTDLDPWLTRHFGFKERLELLLGRPVDLVMDGGLRNPYVIRSIEASRTLLYASADAGLAVAYPRSGAADSRSVTPWWSATLRSSVRRSDASSG